jgi:hypothetical protein
MPHPTLYRVRPGGKPAQLTIEKVWSQAGRSPLGAAYRHIVPLAVAGDTYLVAFDAKGRAVTFRATPAAPWLAPASSRISAGGPFDIVEPFVLGMVPYLLTYASAAGVLSFVPIANDLSSQPPYQFRDVREPVTSGFTVTKPIAVSGLVYILCYNATTGDVDLTSLQVTDVPQPGASPGTPPLMAHRVWVHQWAKSWTHFAFFTMGRENFFFKINVGPKLNVNIDHVLDDPSHGTIEVGTYLQDQLQAPKKIAIVRAFHLDGGDPYFLTYMTPGQTSWFRFRADCQGWTPYASGKTVEDATQIVPFRAGSEQFVLFY